MKIQTSELSGEALNWAVGFSCNKYNIAIFRSLNGCVVLKGAFDPFRPAHENDTCGWQLFNENCTTFHRDPDGTCWATVGMSECSGNTILEAFCRALVTERSGPEVEVPDELVRENKE